MQFIFHFFIAKDFPLIVKIDLTVCQNIANQKNFISQTWKALEPRFKFSKKQFKILQLAKFTMFRFQNS